MNPLLPKNRRILLVDDHRPIHDDFRSILVRQQSDAEALDALESRFFGEAVVTSLVLPTYEIESAYQGQEALAKVQESLRVGRPYSLAFMDVRMPPGWDGIETILRIWEIDPKIHFVVCTAYADYTWEELYQRFGDAENLVFLRKPFDHTEVRQLACAMTSKWAAVQEALLKREELERLVAERTAGLAQAEQDLRKQNAELVALNQQKNGLLGMAAHDLRSPISATISGLELFIEDLADGMEPDSVELLRMLLDNNRFMLRMLNDVLDLATIESGRLDLKPVEADFADLIRRTCFFNRLLASKKGIEIVEDISPGLPCVWFDPGKMEQVINNLLSNAIKFSHPNTRVRVFAGLDGARLVARITDEGQGIPEPEQRSLFQPFKKTSVKSTGGEKSTGLGLAIAKRILEAHAGSIGVQSQVGVGSTFYLTLPVAPEGPAQAPSV